MAKRERRVVAGAEGGGGGACNLVKSASEGASAVLALKCFGKVALRAERERETGESELTKGESERGERKLK